MLIHGTGSSRISVDTATGNRGEAMLHVSEEGDDIDATIRLDANHLEALELAIKAARLELDVRAVGS